MQSTETHAELSPPTGRAAEWTRIRTAVESTGAGAGRTLLIEGPAGSGKSHLLRSIEDLGRSQHRTTIAIRCSLLTADRPFGPVIDGLTLGPAVLATGAAPDVASLTASFAELARSEPVIVTVDDVQDADPGSQEVLLSLSRLAEALPIAVVAAATDWPAATRGWVESIGDEVILRPLGEDGQVELAASLLGRAPGPMLTDLLRSAGGNPLLTVRLVEALRAEDRLRDGEVDGAQLPARFCRVVERFIGDISEDARSLLRAAAVLGPAVRIDRVAAMLGRALCDLIAPIDDLERRGVLRSDGGDQVSFAQPVVREAIHRSLNPAERLELTARAAHELEYDDDRRALELYDHVAGTATTDLESTTSAHVRTLVRSGRFRDAEQLVGAAMATADDDSAGELRAHLTEIRFYRARWNELVADAERWLANRPGTVESDRIGANLAAAHAGLGHTDIAVDLARQVLDRQGAAGDPVARGIAYQVLASALAGSAGADDAVDLAHRAVREAMRMGTWEAYRRHPHTTYAMALADAGRPDEALVVLAEGRALADRLTTAWDDSPYHATSAIITTRLGRWQEAEEHLDRGLEAAAASGAVGPAVDLHATRMVIALGRGDLDTATSVLGAAIRLLGDRPARTVPGLCRSWGALLEARGDLTGARARLLDVWEARPTSLWINAGPALIRLVQQTDGVASPLVAEVATAVAEQASATGAPWIAAYAARCEALVAQDADRLRQAADRFAEMGGVPDELECLVDAIRLAPTSAASEALKARAEERCAAIGGSRRIAATQRRVEREPTRPTRRRAARPVSGWGSLTVAEERVARLVATGHSNAEAGAELFVSARTVESHLRRIFAKLEIRKRVELAVLVGQLDQQ